MNSLIIKNLHKFKLKILYNQTKKQFLKSKKLAYEYGHMLKKSPLWLTQPIKKNLSSQTVLRTSALGDLIFMSRRSRNNSFLLKNIDLCNQKSFW